MDKDNVFFVLLVVLFLIVGCAYTAYTDPEMLAEIQSAQGETQSQSEPITKEDIDKYLPGIVIGLLVVFGLWAAVKIINSEIFVPIFTVVCLIGIVLLASYLWAYGDKDGDGREDAQIIKVVQPQGNSPETDAQYAGINKENTKSNFVGIASISLYIFSCLWRSSPWRGLGWCYTR